MSEDYCCDWFRRMVEKRKERGMSIVPVLAGGRRYFAIRGAAFSERDFLYLTGVDLESGKRRLPIIADQEGLPISSLLKAQIAIKHCPGCGLRLSDWIAIHETEFDREAEGPD